tara:strand:- start:266 stop:922 length:657 start_codon:yes stop_codon:yes gene_type:complete
MPKTKTLVKICGITSKQQAIQIAKLGADAIGIISVKESPRYISAEAKREIFECLASLYPKVQRVSVVKNCPVNQIIKNFLGKPSETTIQLHGDEDINYCKRIKKEIPNLRIWKAIRIKTQSDIDKIKLFENYVDEVLLDSWNEKTYGGSGKRIKINYLENMKISKPWWLAGGISLNCIDEIQKIIMPVGYDISSNIEISPGIKDLKKTEDIIRYLKST